MPNIPILYYSNLRIVNEDNEFSRISHTSHISNNKYAALIENLDRMHNSVQPKAGKNGTTGKTDGVFNA